MKATLDFDNKTISLDGDVTLGELIALQESLTDANEWTVKTETQYVTIPQPYPVQPYPQPWQPYPWGGGTYI